MSWLARKKQFMQAETPDRQWKKIRWLMPNCLMKDMFVFVAREYVEDTQNDTGENASLSTRSKKIYNLQSYLTGKVLGKKPNFGSTDRSKRSCKFQMYTTGCFGPTQIIPSHLISAVTKTLLICCIQEIISGLFHKHHEFRIPEHQPIRISSSISLAGFVAVAHKVKVALVSRGGLLPQHTPGARALASKAMRDKGRGVGLTQ